VNLAQHLQDLIARSTITGRERGLATWLCEAWSDVVDEALVDQMGSYIGLKRGHGSATRLADLPFPGPEDEPETAAYPGARRPGPPKILIAAHIDSIGLMVTKIEPGGFLRVTNVGGVDRRLLQAQEVEVQGRRIVPGLIGSKPPHVTTQAERNKLLPIDDLYVDTGLPEAEVRELIRVGDPVIPRMTTLALQNGRIAGRYMDNRASVAALRYALGELQGKDHGADLFAVGTAGEEFGGLSGAVTTTFAIKPDVAIAVDVTFAKHPGSEEDSFPLGGGPTIGVGPNCSPKLVRLMRRTAEELGINYALEVMPGSSGTDAWGMQVVRGGVATGVLSIPLRYMHTSVETVDLKDIESAGRLIAGIVARLDEAGVEDLSCY
jgi:putative aminopeptidase FrvX